MNDGTLERRDGRQVIRFERRLPHSVERVWRALTAPEEIAQWLALAELELEEGGRVVLTWQNTDDDGNTAVARGTVSELDPPRVLEFDTDIHGRLRWELEPAGEETLLTFTAHAELPEEYELEVLSGWHIHLDHLEHVLEGGSIDWPNWDQVHKPDWDRIRAGYEGEATGDPASQPRSSS
jgi:uncharacterized protein YndB with AHSA1/START domain